MADVVAEGRLPPRAAQARGPRGRGPHRRRAAAAGGVAPREERVRLARVVPGGRRLHCHCVAKAREGPPVGWEIRVGVEEWSEEEGGRGGET